MTETLTQAPPITWSWHEFASLSGADVHAIMAARQAVFVVEQASIYQDADAIDQHAWHLLGRGPQGQILAYARITPPGSRFDEPSIGRVLTMPQARGGGMGRHVVALALEKCAEVHAGRAIRISAQVYLTDFYGSFGFVVDGEPYNEDGIPHIEMVRAPFG